jgi:hypothetical protein
MSTLTDEYAASLISFYLEKFRPTAACFDADLSVTDLTEYRQRFCSPFLVYSLLYNASVRARPRLSYVITRTEGFL